MKKNKKPPSEKIGLRVIETEEDAKGITFTIEGKNRRSKRYLTRLEKISLEQNNNMLGFKRLLKSFTESEEFKPYKKLIPWSKHQI